MIIATQFYHDGTIVVYNKKTKFIKTFDLEKLLEIKHFNLAKTENKNIYWNRIYELLAEHGVDLNDEFDVHVFSTLLQSMLNGSKPMMVIKHPDGNVTPRATGSPTAWYKFLEQKAHEIKANHYDDCHHHLAHAACGYYQSGFRKAIIFTSDGGGDGTRSMLYRGEESGDMHFIESPSAKFEKTELFDPIQFERWPPAFAYSTVCQHIQYFNDTNTHKLDLPGKAMGMCAYGNRDSDAYYATMQTLKSGRILDVHHTLVSIGVAKYKAKYSIYDDAGEYIRTEGVIAKPDFQIAADACRALQDWFEDVTINYLKTKIDLIRKYDNNLVLSGGGALNILCNTRIQDELGVNVFVPPNPADDGLSLGALLRFIHKSGAKINYKRRKKYDFSRQGLPVKLDLNFICKPETGTCEVTNNEKLGLFDYIGKSVTVEDIAKLLENGDIVGIVKERHELGKRALGNRSILADASFPGMKDKINRIKNREHYRPFAPMCRKEDAPIFFEATTFDNLKHMNLEVRVKPEFREKYASITHVDWTARLQTVEKKDDKIIYELLGHIENKVLLNTSFNVAGKPILNHLSSAFRVLQETELNYFVLKLDKKLYLFEKMP